MADKNGQNRGGYRPGAGAPKKSEKLKLATKISRIIKDHNLITELVNIAKNGEKDSDRKEAIKLLLAYGHGTPVATQVTYDGPAETPIIDLIGRPEEDEDVSEDDVTS